jgi:hypothetical protein
MGISVMGHRKSHRSGAAIVAEDSSSSHAVVGQALCRSEGKVKRPARQFFLRVS